MVTDEAQWALLGEAIVAIVPRRHRRLMPLPPGLRRMPGPAVVLAERFVDSPVGPYCSLAVGEPVRLGLRPGYYFGTSVVNVPDARRAGRQYWGFPSELGTLHWSIDDTERRMVWEERGFEVRTEVRDRALPVLLPLRTVQRRTDGPVVVPSRLRAMVRRARVDVGLSDADPFGVLSGSHRGFYLSGMLLRRRGARRALGWFSTFRAPFRAPEPGIIGMARASQPRPWSMLAAAPGASSDGACARSSGNPVLH